jgi:prepilin-type N-terminal cleavage/methylation domain-containing protein
MRPLQNNSANRASRKLLGRSRGFSLIEVLVIVAIGTILTVIAIPSISSGLRNYRLEGAISSVTWAVHSTRYQALMEGYPFQVVFSSAANTYQIQSSPTGVAGPYSNVGSATPFSAYPVTLSADTTLNFRPNGFVQATTGTLVFNVAYQGVCQKISVTNYGNVSISPKYPQPTCP